MFESFYSNNEWYYFRIDLEELEPRIPDSFHREFYDDILRLKNGDYVETSKEDDYSYDQYEKITFILSGSIVIFSKSSTYNADSTTYDGRHNKMNSEKFRSYIQKNAVRT